MSENLVQPRQQVSVGLRDGTGGRHLPGDIAAEASLNCLTDDLARADTVSPGEFFEFISDAVLDTNAHRNHADLLYDGRMKRRTPIHGRTSLLY